LVTCTDEIKIALRLGNASRRVGSSGPTCRTFKKPDATPEVAVPQKLAEPIKNKPTSLRPGESVVTAPVKLLCKTMMQILERMRDKNWKRPDIDEDLLKLSSVAQGLNLIPKLVSFHAVPGPLLSREELEAGAILLARLLPELSAEEVQRRAYTAEDCGRGRPVERRYVAAAALEAQWNNPKLTRLELAKMFCPCRKRQHDRDCAKRLRRDVLRLKKLLKDLIKKTTG